MEATLVATAEHPVLEELARAERLRARAEAEATGLQLAYIEQVESECRLAGRPRRVAELEVEAAVDELSLITREPSSRIHERVTAARFAARHLPSVTAAFDRGDIDAARFTAIVHAARRLEHHESRDRLQTAAVEYAARHTLRQLTAWLRRFVAKAEPERLARRAREEHERRGVWINPTDDGNAWVHALVGGAEAMRIERRLEAGARAGRDGRRSIEQRRADVFCDLLLERDAAEPTIVSRTVVGVTVPVMSLAGISEEAGISLDGELALPAEAIRELAAEPGTLFYRLLTDPAGRLLDVTELGRFPSTGLRQALGFREGSCRFPTCSQPAERCDVDHRDPYPGGPTQGANLQALCRRHHRLKTLGAMRFEIGPAPPAPAGHVALPSGRAAETAFGRPHHPEAEAMARQRLVVEYAPPRAADAEREDHSD